VGLNIAGRQFPISDWAVADQPIDNRQLEIDNVDNHPLPRGGTDLLYAS